MIRKQASIGLLRDKFIPKNKGKKNRERETRQCGENNGGSNFLLPSMAV